MNERARISYLFGEPVGHYNLQLARTHNELMRQLGQPLPHPTLPPLAPRSAALQGIEYEKAEIERQHMKRKQEAALDALKSSDVRAHALALRTATEAATAEAAPEAVPEVARAQAGPQASSSSCHAELPIASAGSGRASSVAVKGETFPLPPEFDPALLAQHFARAADGRGPAAKRVRPVAEQDIGCEEVDLPGIVQGMRTHGRGRQYQLRGFTMRNADEWKHQPDKQPPLPALCLPTCPGHRKGKGKGGGKRDCQPGCERAIIKRARLARDILD